ncbi:MAG: hypothetical protein JNK16_15180 [Phycisphaerales bacterium]|nr:hypothetical protein [Phycisphaerales bacterium]
MSALPPRPSALSEPPFYVGYLPVPKPLAAFLWLAVPIALSILAIVAIATARSQRDPGGAVWNDAKAREFHGIFIARPYPMLLVRPTEGDTSKPDSLKRDTTSSSELFLLVEMGKHAGRDGLSAMDGKPVVASGWTLERDGRRMIELEPDAKALALQETSISVPPTPVIVPRGRVTLQGEIVDSKCYLGAMKPGEGKTHKACATLCIRGGIPPVLVTRDENEARVYYLLVDPSGGPLDSGAWPFIGDPVEVTGDFELLGEFRVLKLSPRDISRR